MGLSSIIAGLALFVALGALWFVSDVMRRIDRQAETLLESHIRPLRDVVNEATKAQNSLTGKVSTIEATLKKLEGRKAVTMEELLVVKQSIKNLEEKLESLDKQIPSRYRIAVKKTSVHS